MDNHSPAHDEAGNHAKPGQSASHRPAPTKSELMSSAKLLGEAAKAKFNHEPSRVDPAQLASAAANVLNAASHYGKLDDKGMGKYVEQAENYLHNYHGSNNNSHSSHSPTAVASAATTGSDHHSTAAAGGEHAHSSGHTAGGDHSGGGYGEYAKIVGDFLKKH